MVYIINFFIFAIYLHAPIMRQFSVTIILFSLIWITTYSQENTETFMNQKLEAMNKLSFMTGSWEGTGWIQMGNGSKETFKVSETVQKKLRGLVYLIEGHGTTGGDTTHNAIAIISWDAEKKEYSFESHTFDGRSADASAVLEGKNFTWGFDIPGRGKIRYDLKITEDNKWNEKGFFSPDGDTWYPFMEMNLERIR